jgi:hypothetical protein
MKFNQLFVAGTLQSLIINIVHILLVNGATSMKINNLSRGDTRSI